MKEVPKIVAAITILLLILIIRRRRIIVLQVAIQYFIQLTGGIQLYPAASAVAWRLQLTPPGLVFVKEVGDDECTLFSILGAFPKGGGGCIDDMV